jgi:hypothetical protein
MAFLDADDAWHPEKLEIQYGWMRGNPDVVITGHQVRRMVSGQEDARIPRTWQVHRIERNGLLLSNRFPTRTVMLKRNVPVRFTPEKRRSEDYLAWLELILRGGVGYRLELPLAFRYKAPFGEGGLSGDLWKMEKGELDCYARLWRSSLITFAELAGYGTLSIAKFFGRIVSLGARRAGL